MSLGKSFAGKEGALLSNIRTTTGWAFRALNFFWSRGNTGMLHLCPEKRTEKKELTFPCSCSIVTPQVNLARAFPMMSVKEKIKENQDAARATN
jgi:hypothetical protein